jgi:hypothetical protein
MTSGIGFQPREKSLSGEMSNHTSQGAQYCLHQNRCLEMIVRN